MASRILGRLPLDEDRLAQDMARLAQAPAPQEPYEVFTTGRWVNLNLWNASGDDGDGFFNGHRQVAGRPTRLLGGVPYIGELLTTWFNTELLTMVRARNVVEWSIVPHRDFLESGPAEDFFRVLIFLEDNEHALNSDEDMVFHMRKGEVWFLDSAQIHAGVNISSRSRWSLCLDFKAGTGFSPGDVFARAGDYDPAIRPALVERAPAPADLPDRLRALSAVVSRHNIKDIAFLLGKVHFTEEVPIGASWDWLVEITRASGDPALLDLAERARRFFVHSREVYEEFSFVPA
ncbi:aspartyl/asparaginyl beta-hydroxylase domain-containing protein [Streptosporangium roseum]|uniref:aspartyl/asparaginyl beta-hydroxylase domain-containing protein n=1 Tax=Streptosporangium roseum TaxID=2001 RepID=UPI00331C202D